MTRVKTVAQAPRPRETTKAKDKGLLGLLFLSSKEPAVVKNALEILSGLIDADKKDINDEALFSKLVSLAKGKDPGVRNIVLSLFFIGTLYKINRTHYQDLLDTAVYLLENGDKSGTTRYSIVLLNALHSAGFIKQGDEKVLTVLATANPHLNREIEVERQAVISNLLRKETSAGKKVRGGN